VVSSGTFQIKLDTSTYSPYESSGLAKYIKTPKVLEFKPLKDYFDTYSKIFEDFKSEKLTKLSMEMIEEAQNQAGFFDDNMIWADFEKIQEMRLTDFIFACMNHFEELDGLDFLDELLESGNDKADKDKLMKTLFKILYMVDSNQSKLPALVAFVGGMVSQEIVKAITQKFVPIK